MEQIDITSNDDKTLFTDEEHIAVDNIDFEFEQTHKARGIYRKITVFNEKHCYQSIKIKHKRKYKYRVNLAYLNPRPFRVFNIAWKYLVFALISLVTSLIMIYFKWFEQVYALTSDVYFKTAIIFSVVSTIILFLLFVHNSHDKIIFKSQVAGMNLVELLNKYPNQDSFREFMRQFITQIKKVQVKEKLEASKYLAAELRELRRLRNETVITDTQYQNCKQVIFSDSAYSNN